MDANTDPITDPKLEQPGTQPEDAEDTDRRPRRKRVATVAIPEEIHAIAVLTSRDPAAIIEDMLAAQVSAIRTRAADLLGRAV